VTFPFLSQQRSFPIYLRYNCDFTVESKSVDFNIILEVSVLEEGLKIVKSPVIVSPVLSTAPILVNTDFF
jgi:hypothetical protein